MLELAGVGEGDLVYDLGSGDGRVVLAAARDFGARAVGIEVDPVRYAWSRARVAAADLGERARIERGDFFTRDLSDADVIVCFLMQWSSDLLAEKLARELRPGARIVSNRWRFPGFTEIARDRTGRLRVYEV
jgi:predicted RNA methylase